MRKGLAHGKDNIANLIKKNVEVLLSNDMNLSITQEEANSIIDALKKDILKEDRIKKVVKSIEHQNVKVQPLKDNDYLLALSSCNNPKKRHIFDFIVDYANASEEDNSGKVSKRDMLINMRKLIILYVCGKKAYEELDRVDMWRYTDTDYEVGVKGYFNDRAYKDCIEYEATEKSDKVEKNVLRTKIIDCLNYSIVGAYKESISVLKEKEIFDENVRGWINYIEEEVKKILMPRGKIASSYKMKNDYLCKRVWDNWISFIAEKYIDMGKGVYHFVLPDDMADTTKEISIKNVKPEFRDGITSFDYEYIKAEESLNKDMSVAITSAVNNFSRAVKIVDDSKLSDKEKDKKDDILSYYSKKVFNAYCDVTNCKRNILQYFGGESKYKEIDVLSDSTEAFKLFGVVRDNLSCIRNASFHFASNIDDRASVSDIIQELYKAEAKDYTRIIREKYYSNNLYMFYNESDLIPLMNKLYTSVNVRPAQIPAFNRIINKDNIMDFLYNVKKGVINAKSYREVTSNEKDEALYNSAMNFLLKEIYYNSFICHKDCILWFNKATQLTNNKAKGTDKERPNKAFFNRITEIMREDNISFGEVCQQIMTDINIQNDDTHTVKNNVDELKLKNYRELLFKGIRDAFSWYLKKVFAEFFEKIAYPRKKESKVSKNDYLKDWSSDKYVNMCSEILKKVEFASWYVTAHFIDSSQINYFMGDVKNYIQFVRNIQRREKGVTGSNKRTDINKKVIFCENLLKVLEMVLISSGQISDTVTDYFNDDEEYAKFLSNYVDFDSDDSDDELNISFRAKLFKFTTDAKNTGENDIIDIYTDAENIKLNRNIVLSKMFGLGIYGNSWFDKITLEEIEDFYELKNKLCISRDNSSNKILYKKEKCKTPKEQIDRVNFNNKKNRVELTDVLDYSDIIMDMYSQLVTWTYMRERDLLYMQLGVAYLALYFGDKSYQNDNIFSDNRLNTLEGDINIKEGAILYHLTAINTSILKMYEVKDKRAIELKSIGNTIGERTGVFYSNYLNKNEFFYKNGLCFFENYGMHNYIVKNIRNYIDHFKYFSNGEKNILDIYSEVYSYYFSYSRKLQKSVSFILLNILERYFVKTWLCMEESIDEHEMEYEDKDNKKIKKVIKYKRANFKLNNIESKNMTYKKIKFNEKYKDYFKKGKFQYNARSDKFLEQLEKLLYYKKDR